MIPFRQWVVLQKSIPIKDSFSTSSLVTTFKKSEIVKMIAEQREKRDWHMIYLSEDIDTFAQGNSMGINNYTTNAEGLRTKTRGAENVCVGYQALGKGLTTGSCNTAIGNCRMKKSANFSSLSKF